jgi:hypothetical protein
MTGNNKQLSSAYNNHFIAACLPGLVKQNKTKQVVTFLKTKKVSSTLYLHKKVLLKKNKILQTKVLENCKYPQKSCISTLESKCKDPHSRKQMNHLRG